jgi:SAM-dependent methyltransferase
MPYSLRAPIYEVEYAETRDIPFIRSLIGAARPSVLEVPCGAGRLSRGIADLARCLTVVDLVPDMAAKAASAARSAPGSGEVTPIVADMRTLALSSEFEFAIIPREALQLLSPDEGALALAAVGRHVAPGGAMLVDLASFSRIAREPPDPDYYDPSRKDGAWRADWTRPAGGAARLRRWSAQHHQPEGSAILFQLHYELDNAPDPRESWRSEMTLHIYPRQWIDEHVPPGWLLDTVLGDYDGAPWRPSSPRMIALFRNPHASAQ